MPKSFTDNLLEALTDSRIIEALNKALEPTIRRIVDDVLNVKLAKVEQDIVELQTENTQLKAVNTDVTKRLNDLETFTRRENIIISGLPEGSFAEVASASSGSTTTDMAQESSSVAVEQTVINFCHEKLNINIGHGDISVAHRLKKGSRDTVRPILVRFISRNVRDGIMRAKKALKTSGDPEDKKIFISDHLTNETAMLFFEARKRVRSKHLFSTWTMKGKVYVKMTAAPTEKPKLVTSITDLP